MCTYVDIKSNNLKTICYGFLFVIAEFQYTGYELGKSKEPQMKNYHFHSCVIYYTKTLHATVFL